MFRSNATVSRRRGQNVQLWTTGVASARGAARTAQEIEAAGWEVRDVDAEPGFQLVPKR